MGFFNRIKNNMIEASLRAGKAKACRQLLAMSDRQLEDFGMSRELLEQGISAWPWKAEHTGEYAGEGLAIVPAITQVAPAKPSRKVIRQAVSELSAYSDRELAELGITRDTIEEAVQYGRPAIEGIFQNNRSVA